jgi:hypothetical protein
MAKIDNLFDTGRGTLANLVYYKLNGIGIVRSKPGHFKDAKSPAQLAQRQRLQVVNDFLRPFLKLIRISFIPEIAGRTARSEAQSYIMRNALAGEYPDIFVDKSKVLLSRGPLPLPESATVTAQPEGLLIKWQNGPEAESRHKNDTLVVMALWANAGSGDYQFTGVSRSDSQYLWKPALHKGNDAVPDVWIAFRNIGQTEMSDSMWIR